MASGSLVCRFGFLFRLYFRWWIRRIPTSGRWWWFATAGFIPMVKTHCSPVMGVLFFLCSFAEAQVSTLTLASFVNVAFLLDDLLKHLWRVSSTSFMNKLSWKCFLFIFIYLYGDKSVVNSSMCSIQGTWSVF